MSNKPIETKGSNHFVFVYGTLKRGECNDPMMKNAEFHGLAVTVQRFPFVVSHGILPLVFEWPGVGFNIKGELYEVTFEQLQEIDELEGCPTLYFRRQIRIAHEHGYVYAWVYFANQGWFHYRNENDGEDVKLIDEYKS